MWQEVRIWPAYFWISFLLKTKQPKNLYAGLPAHVRVYTHHGSFGQLCWEQLEGKVLSLCTARGLLLYIASLV